MAAARRRAQHGSARGPFSVPPPRARPAGGAFRPSHGNCATAETPRSPLASCRHTGLGRGGRGRLGDPAAGSPQVGAAAALSP